ncbi:hypothetical protein ACFWGN_14930 [Oerskovia sp. NPDC060338]|jgi:hypothetical protein|uniref:Uncharacterized protein n=1 Tax=Oerskovia enterophila TaxID=43678 RepID=A0ABX2YAP9_9CELL|nr:hypothetical protein [Oerskovia enterophila]OCI32799.1 hypothetical protein OERS_03910 [Oerskovia enterophila]
MTKVDFAAGWAKLWAALSGAVPGLAGILAVLGTAVAAYAVAKFIIAKRKGSGNPKELGWMLAISALIIIPNVVIPLVLKFASFIVNFVIGLFSGM